MRYLERHKFIPYIIVGEVTNKSIQIKKVETKNQINFYNFKSLRQTKEINTFRGDDNASETAI